MNLSINITTWSTRPAMGDYISTIQRIAYQFHGLLLTLRLDAGDVRRLLDVMFNTPDRRRVDRRNVVADRRKF